MNFLNNYKDSYGRVFNTKNHNREKILDSMKTRKAARKKNKFLNDRTIGPLYENLRHFKTLAGYYRHVTGARIQASKCYFVYYFFLKYALMIC